jgi:hypothetical protein
MTNGQGQISPAQALVQFTGYYASEAVPSAFVSVDTNSVWTAGAPAVEYSAKIAVSTDGKSSAHYDVGADWSFNQGCLVIPGPDGGTIGELTFTKDAGVCSMTGTIDGAPVSGTTPFGPIPISLWTGTYYRQGEPIMPIQPPQYPYAAALQIDADGSVQFASAGGTLQPVPSYSYSFGMFVIGLALESGEQLFEMGTASEWGRVAGDATDGSMLVAIQLQEPAPHL